nr:hypothetical protein [Tanacetum cinerariifolium]
MFCQFIQKKQEEKQIEKEQAAKAQNLKILACCDDDDDYNFAITPSEPIDSLSMGDEHLDTILATKLDEFIKSSVENLVLNPSESEGENKCDVPAGFTTFSNVHFDADYDFYSVDAQSFFDEDFSKKIYSNPLFDEEIIPMKIDPHSFNAESDLIESMLNHDYLIIISLKIDSLFDEFVGELTLLKSIPLGINETDCHPEKETRFTKRLLYDNSSPRPPKEFVSDNSDADIESFSPSSIPIKDSDPLMEEIDLSFTSDDPMSSGIEEDDHDSERDIPLLEELVDNYSLLLLENESYHFDIPSSSRPPAKPPDGNTGTLNIKMMGDISKQKYSQKCEDSRQRILYSSLHFFSFILGITNGSRYQALKKKPQTEAQARKNMMIYLRNIAGFKMDYFKGMSYDDIRPIFEKYFNSNMAFLKKTKEQMEEEEDRALKGASKSQAEKATKKQKLDEELKRHLQIVPNDEDDVYTEATPLARKVPVVDYEIYT